MVASLKGEVEDGAGGVGEIREDDDREGRVGESVGAATGAGFFAGVAQEFAIIGKVFEPEAVGVGLGFVEGNVFF